jgi:hypothetical protein
VVTLPLKIERLRRLAVYGTGVVGRDIDCTPDTVPETIEVALLPPLLTGTLELPAGVGKDVKPSVGMELTAQGSRMAFSAELRNYDPATGAFTLDRVEEKEPVYEYKVTIAIPGFKPWVKAGFKANAEGTPPHVTVTFERE